MFINCRESIVRALIFCVASFNVIHNYPSRNSAKSKKDTFITRELEGELILAI